MNRKLVEALGWYGVAAILAAYSALNFGLLTTQDFWYHFLNITGGLGILVDAYMQRNYQPVVLNVVWVAIGLISIVQILF